jgi:hypothetical protein
MHMFTLPFEIIEPVTAFARKAGVTVDELLDCLIWLKYYWDFCKKYSHTPAKPASLSPFFNKLVQKKQGKSEIEQAQYAVELFDRLLNSYNNPPDADIAKSSKETKKPSLINSTDAKMYLTQLAVEKKVAASTQNQAFNALLFFYSHVLKKEFGEFRNIPRAKRTK